jgi:hypothetical protein
MNQCCFPGCRKPIPESHLACHDHWFRISTDEQRDAQRRLHNGDEWGAREMLILTFRAQIRREAESQF